MIEIILVISLGIIIGSFLNVCIFRIPNEESISYPPSHCTICEHKLRILDLIPIISYIFLKGRCKYCGKKISIQYPVIEIINAILYFTFVNKYGLTLLSLKYCIMASILIVIAVIDLKTQYVYSSVILTGGICGLLCIIGQLYINKQSIITYFMGALIAFIIIGLIVVISHGMGEGDIEIAAMCGLFLGVKGILLTLFLSIVIGGIVGIILLLFKLRNIKDEISFGPCLAIGALVSALFGNELINLYLSLFI